MYEDQEIEGEVSSGTALAAIPGGSVTQQVRTNYTTAMSVQQPRALAAVQQRFLEESRLMGEAAYYGWAAGKDRIEGPSQALAYAAARCWGNCAVDQQPLEETPDAWVFNSVFVDCETGFTLTRKFRQSKKWTIHGKLDAERKDDVRFQIGQTKGDRNVILKALPKWLINKGMEEAKAGVRKKLEGYIAKHGMPAAIDYALKELAKSGVDESRVCTKFSVVKKSALTVDNLVIIAGDIQAIQQGQEYPDALYPVDEAADIAVQLAGGKKKPQAAPKDAETTQDVAAETPKSGTPSTPETPKETMDQIDKHGQAAYAKLQADRNDDEAETVAQWKVDIKELQTLMECKNAKSNIPDISAAGKQSIVNAIEMREAEIRGERGGKSNQRILV